MSLSVAEIDLSDVPIAALRDTTRNELEIALNKLSVLPTDEGNIPRDWRGIAHLTGVNSYSLTQSKNPISDILKLWDKERISKGKKRPSIQELQDMFGQLDRWDIYDDTAEMMMKDAEDYVSRSFQIQPVVEDVKSPFENNCLTTDDMEQFRRGLPLDTYDAFILYADEDTDFAAVMIAKLQNEYRLRVCAKHSILAGVGFEFKAVTKLIAERCSSLIVILSPHFLNSEENMFFLTFAQALSIEQQKKKIIPCVYSQCKLPLEISYLCFLDYRRSELFGNFWNRLKDSIQASMGAPRGSESRREAIMDRNIHTQVRCTITEVNSSEISTIVDPPPNGQTAIVRMSDPTTFYPGNSIESASTEQASVDQWDAFKPQSNCDIDIELARKSDKDVGFRSLLSRIKTSSSKQKKKWFKKKKELAFSA